jgi:hypothetical protein
MASCGDIAGYAEMLSFERVGGDGVGYSATRPRAYLREDEEKE